MPIVITLVISIYTTLFFISSTDADDFQLNTQGELVLQPSTTVEVSVTLNADLVALESVGLFNLRINVITSLRENEFIVDLLRVVIIDQDSRCYAICPDINANYSGTPLKGHP